VKEPVTQDARPIVDLGALEEDEEFVGSEPGHDVVGPDGSLQPGGNFSQHLVADLVAEGVVHGVEAVEIDLDDGKLTGLLC